MTLGVRSVSRAVREHRDSPRFLPEIQGLRAIAVGLVVFFHLWPNRIPGGYIGVDVFFVISGFLITAHLTRELERTGRVDVVRFWARRIRRLLPASLLVLVVVAAGCYLVAPLGMWEPIFKNIAASALYVENWSLAADAVDYWAQDGNAPPTQHYWSLSVEEQFYLVWPLLFLIVGLAVRRWSKRKVPPIQAVLGGVAVVSFAYSVVFSLQNPGVAYFSTFTRVWEFAVGGLLVFVVGRMGSRPGFRALTAWLGIAVILVSSGLIDSTTPFPGFAAAAPVLGTSLVIVAATTGAAGSFDRLSSTRPVKFLGDTSYSIYLWHWPLITLLPWVFGPLSTVGKIAIVAATIVLAAATKRWIEDPGRTMPLLTRRGSIGSFVAAGVASAVIVGAAALSPVVAGSVIGGRLADAQEYAASGGSCVGAAAAIDAQCPPGSPRSSIPSADIVVQDFDPRIEECFSQDDNSEVIVCRLGERDGPSARVALVGDSHAGAVAPALMALATERGWSLDVYLKPGCPWSDVIRYREDGNATAVQNCENWREGVASDLVAPDADYDAIITTSYAIVGNMVLTADGADPVETSIQGLRNAWDGFHEVSDAPIIVLRDNPNWDSSPVDCLLYHREPCTESLTAAFSNTDPQVQATAGMSNVDLIDLTDVYCPDDLCAATIGGVTVYRDAHHLSRSFALSMSSILGDRLAAAAPVLGDQERAS